MVPLGRSARRPMVHSHSLKTEALVLGSRRLGEADRVVTLYTRERGRLSAVAKGIRRTRVQDGRASGTLQPGARGPISGRSLYTVTGVDTIRTFQAVRDSLFRMEEGARLLEAVRRLFPEEEEHAAAFNLLVRGVAGLSRRPGDRAAAARVVLATRLKLLLVLRLPARARFLRRLRDRGMLCGFRPSQGGCCARGLLHGEGARLLPVSPEGLAALRALLEQPSQRGGRLGPRRADADEVECICPSDPGVSRALRAGPPAES